jgi:RNA polymerase-binding protein DksA
MSVKPATVSKAGGRSPATGAGPSLARSGELGVSGGGAKAARATHLSKADIQHFRELLLDKRRQLMGDVGGLQSEALNSNRRDASGDLSNMPLHMADVGSDNYEQELTLGLIEGERALLGEILEALDRIEKGTYGICVATGQPISKARLNATPWTKYCYEYMLAQENRRR